MKNNLKSKKMGCIISSFAIFISFLNMLLCFISNKPMGSAVAIFCSMLTVFFVNMDAYQKQVKKERTLKKRD